MIPTKPSFVSLLFLSSFVCLSLQAGPFKCPEGYNGLVTNPECCEEYFICTPGKDIQVKSCKNEKKFDSEIFECVRSKKVRCEEEFTYSLEDGNRFVYYPAGIYRSDSSKRNSNSRTFSCSNGSPLSPSNDINNSDAEIQINDKPDLNDEDYEDDENDENDNENGDENDTEVDDENVHTKTINLNLNVHPVLDKIVIKREKEPEKPEVKPENDNFHKGIKTEPKKKAKKVKVNLVIENPDQIQALVDKDKGRQLIQNLMDSIPPSEHQKEIAKIFSDTVQQAIAKLNAEKAKHGSNLSDGKIKLSLLIDDPKHVKSLIQEAGEQQMAEKLRSELPQNEMTILDSIWGAVQRSADKNR